MAIVKLTSANPDFSFVIQKNPTSGIRFKSWKMGMICSWFKSGDMTSYNVLFRDGADEISYKKDQEQEFEHLDTSRFNASLFIMHVIDEVFRSAFKNKDPKDLPGFENSFFINLLHVKRVSYLEAYKKHFAEDFKIEYTEVVADNYQVTISSNKTIFELLNFASLLGVFISVINEENLYVTGDSILKYISCLSVVDAPYFIKYMFKTRVIPTKELFGQFKKALEKSDKDKLELSYGDNFISRVNFVRSALSFKNSIMDLGCGELKYATMFAPHIKDLNYYAIDIDKEVLESAKKRARNKQLENVYFFESLKDFKTVEIQDKLDVICTEVIEHQNSLDDAKKLVRGVLKDPRVNSIVITTPNADFNVNYFAGEQMRHADHKFELSKADFYKFIMDCSESDMTAEFYDIGDKVNDVPTTQGAVIRKSVK